MGPVAPSNESTCWLAVYQMAYQTIGRGAQDVTDRLRGLVDLNTTLKDGEQETAGRALGFVSTYASTLAGIDSLKWYLATQGVVKASISVSDSAHAILLVGVDTDSDQVYFHNPWSADWSANRSSDVKERHTSFKLLKGMLNDRGSIKGSLQYYNGKFDETKSDPARPIYT